MHVYHAFVFGIATYPNSGHYINSRGRIHDRKYIAGDYFVKEAMTIIVTGFDD